MTLSVCMIVGQDTGQLPRALASAACMADEIIIAGTNGVEEVEKISAPYQARVFNFPWTDDFSAARNAAFAQATQDWILWLDGDEWLDPPACGELASCLQQSTVLAWLITIADRSGPDHQPRFSPTPLLRLFRRRSELKLTGRVHEHFDPSLDITAHQLALHVKPLNLTIYHDGYTPEREMDKLRRNVRLMELQLQDCPGQLFYQVRLSQALLKLDDPRAFYFLGEAFNQIRPLLAHRAAPSEPLVAELLDSVIVRQSRGEFDSGLAVDELLQAALRWFPHWPPLIWRRANRQFKQGHTADAAKLLEKILELARAGTYQQTPSFDAALLGAETHLNLGICYAKLQRFQDAQRCFMLAADGPAKCAVAKRNLELLAAAQRGR